MNRQEIKYIFFSAVFAFVWFIFLLPMLIKIFADKSPLINFLIFTIGIFIFLFIFLKSLTTATGFNIRTSLGLITLFLALSAWMPPYLVDSHGQLNTSITLGSSAIDYNLGLIAQSLGLSGFLVYVFTYILAPLILLFLSAKILPNFVRSLG
mgnify:CR=1 FL=1